MKYSDQLAKTLLARFPDPDGYPYRSWSYSQGFMLWGFIRLYGKTGLAAYREYVLRYCEEHVNGRGEISGFTGCSLDDIMAGSVLVWAFSETGEAKYRLACERVREAFNGYPRNDNGGFWHAKRLPGEMWVDGLFMGLMFLTRYGKYIADADYCFGETVSQLQIVFECCEKDSSGLLYHAYSQNPEVFWAHPITGKSSEIWCEGLGWYAMMLVDALELIPQEQPGRERLIMQLEKLAGGLQLVQDGTSGLWYQVVDKPRYKENWHDTSGSAMFAYALHKAARLGFIDGGYLNVARKAFEGLKTKCLVDPDGYINVYDACDGLCVQSGFNAYVRYPRNVNCKEAVAAVFWAAAEMEYWK